MASSKRKVEWMIIGAQKAGTTAMFDMMSQHPEVCAPAVKECHFFDKKWGKGIKWYHKLFDETDGKMGEATPRYMHDERAAPRIHEYNPDMKMICILRNPADRARSAWGMHARGRAKTAHFDTYFNNSAWRRRIGKYHLHLERFFKLFDREQIKLILFEDFVEAPKSIVRDCWEFIGVDRWCPVSDNYRQNHRNYPDYTVEEREKILEFYLPSVEKLEEMTGWDLQNWKPNRCLKAKEATQNLRPLHISEISDD